MIIFLYKIWFIIWLTLFHIFYIYLEPKVVYLYFDILYLCIFLWKRAWDNHKFPDFVYKISWIIPFLIVMYGMVLFEEVIAALVNNLIEGFDASLFIIRIQQFWWFNIFAFSPIILSILVFYYLRFFSKRQLLIWGAIYWIVWEWIAMTIITNPILFAVYAPIVIYIYYLILRPGMYFLPEDQEKNLRTGLGKYIYAIIIWAILVSFFSSILGSLREKYPERFPPCEMIACDKK